MAARTLPLTIGEVARRAGVRTSALRYYERVGLLPAPSRSSGQRRYGPAAVDRLYLIGYAKRAGFRLGEIKTLLDAGRQPGKAGRVADGWRRIVPGKIAELEREMTRLEQARLRLRALLDCRCRQPEECGRQLQGVSGKRSRTRGGSPA